MQPSNPLSSAEDAPRGRPPTVLQVLPALETGGVEQGTVDVAIATAEAGWRALVASAGGPKVYAIERAGGTHITLPLETKNPLKIWRNAARLVRLIETEAIALVRELKKASTSMLQRRFRIGYTRAARIVDQLEEAGIVGPFNGTKAREVLVDDEGELEQLLHGDDDDDEPPSDDE